MDTAESTLIPRLAQIQSHLKNPKPSYEDEDEPVHDLLSGFRVTGAAEVGWGDGLRKLGEVWKQVRKSKPEEWISERQGQICKLALHIHEKLVEENWLEALDEEDPDFIPEGMCTTDESEDDEDEDGMRVDNEELANILPNKIAGGRGKSRRGERMRVESVSLIGFCCWVVNLR